MRRRHVAMHSRDTLPYSTPMIKLPPAYRQIFAAIFSFIIFR
jgi:hypothetical protein